MYYCRVEQHSVYDGGPPLATFVITFPRIVLAEVVTHRRNSDTWVGDGWAERTTTSDISKNSASSRAIPFSRLVDAVVKNPYIPERFSRNAAGMQENGFFSGADHERCVEQWLKARDSAVEAAYRLHELGVHKQDVNRLLEPFAWVSQVVTSSNWDNFFALRCHRDAHPAFRRIARMMFLALRKSVPDSLHYGQWHLPFVERERAKSFRWLPDKLPSLGLVRARPDEIPFLLRASAARCAWVSYENHDKDGSDAKLQATWERLIHAGSDDPVHASPLEHQAMQLPAIHPPDLQSNLPGWLQLRKLLPREQVARYEPSEKEIAEWEAELACLDQLARLNRSSRREAAAAASS